MIKIAFKHLPAAALAAAVWLGAAGTGLADVKIGATVSVTGPAASLGIPYKNTLELLPKEIAGEKIEWIILDDGSDPTTAVKNVKKLISEYNVDAIVGANTSPIGVANIDVVAEGKTPFLVQAATARMVLPMDDKRYWVFKQSQADSMMVQAIIAHMKKSGVQTVAFMGFNDAFGDSFWDEFRKAAQQAGLKIVASERYARTDTSVTGQVLKIVSAKPDAVFIAAVGTPAALPAAALKDRGYQGKQYQTHAVLNADFLRVGGKAVEGTILSAGPMLVAEQLPDSDPVKPVALAYVRAYEEKYGAGSRAGFGGHAYDAYALLAAALPKALKVAKPGTPEFRQALRDAIEASKDVPGAHGVFTLTPADHVGLDNRARVIVQVKDGSWKLIDLLATD